MVSVLSRRLALLVALWSAAGLARAAAISGRVRDAQGKPASGARVSWELYRGEREVALDSGTPTALLGQARTDGNGAFTIDAGDASVSLRLEASGLPDAVFAGPFAGVAADLGDVVLPAVAPVAGAVVSTNGAAIPGARVEVTSAAGAASDVVFVAAATAGADGTFRLASAPSGPRVLRVRAPGFVPVERSIPGVDVVERVVLERGSVLAGSVTDAAGRPAAGAIVFSTNVGVRTDASGRYRLAGVAAGARRVEAALGRDQIAVRGPIAVRDGAELGVDLHLAPAGSIRGGVIDAATRRPLAGARISILDPAGTPAAPRMRVATDAAGKFDAAPLAPGSYAVRAQGTGYLATTLSGVTVRAGATGTAAVALARGASISGRVVDEKGLAVSGARVRLASPGPAGPGAWRRPGARVQAAETVTGPDGAFRLEPLGPARGQALEAAKAGFVTASRAVTLETGQTLSGVALTLRAGISARGRVTDEEGSALAGVEVRVAPSEERGGRRFFRGPPNATEPPNATTAGDGSFVVNGLEEGVYRATASRDGFAPKTASSLAVRRKPAAVWPTFVLSRGAGVGGTVRDASGAPVAGAVVQLLVEDGAPRTAATDGAGVFRVTSLPAGRPVMLAVTASGFATARRTATPPAENLAIVLGRNGGLRGRVSDADTGDPISDFTVGWSARPPGGRGFAFGGGGGPPAMGQASEAFHAEDGTFEAEGVAPGTWTITASAPGYRPADVAGVEVAVAEVKEGVVLSLHRGTALTGRVVDASTGNPVPNASVTFAAAGTPGAAAASPSAATDADGKFALEGLGAGKSTVTATHPDYETASKDVDPSATPDVVIGLGRGAAISGAVIGASGGGPVAGAAVSLAPEGDAGGNGPQTVQADAGGLFRFDHLTAGRYRLSAQSKAASSAPQELVLADGQAMDGVQVPLASGVQLDGTVSGLPAGKLGGVSVTATADGYRGTAVTGDDGKFTLQGVPTGPVRLTASTAVLQGRSNAQTVEVPDDAQELPVEVVFQGASRLSGQVTRSGKPLPSLVVAAVPDPPDGSGQRFSGMTDDTGHYDLEGLADGGYAVTINGQGVSYRRTFSVSGDTNGDVALPGLAVSGTVTDSATGAPVDGANVQAETGQESQAFAVKRAVTDSNGSYSIADVDPGSYQVTARKAGYQLKTQTASVDAQAVQLDFALDSGSGLSIRVADGLTGMPLGGVTALAFGAGGTVAFQGPVSLDASGAGEIPSLSPGQYFVSVFAPAYAPRSLPAVTVPSDPVSLSMTPGGRVEVRATAAANGRLADGSGAAVLLSPFRLGGGLTIAPPISVWQHVAPGGYTFLLASPDGEKPYPFTVAEGQTTTLVLP